MSETNNDFNQWFESIQNESDFLKRAEMLKNSYKKDLSKKDKDAFEDIFEFFANKYKKGLSFDLKSLYVYMTKVKGWPDFDYKAYAKLLILIGLCGFEWK